MPCYAVIRLIGGPPTRARPGPGPALTTVVLGGQFVRIFGAGHKADDAEVRPAGSDAAQVMARQFTCITGSRPATQPLTRGASSTPRGSRRCRIRAVSARAPPPVRRSRHILKDDVFAEDGRMPRPDRRMRQPPKYCRGLASGRTALCLYARYLALKCTGRRAGSPPTCPSGHPSGRPFIAPRPSFDVPHVVLRRPPYRPSTSPMLSFNRPRTSRQCPRAAHAPAGWGPDREPQDRGQVFEIFGTTAAGRRSKSHSALHSFAVARSTQSCGRV